MTSTFSLDDLLAHFRKTSATVHDQGTSFEDFIKAYLQTDPQYADRLQAVWRWRDWPLRWANPDRGIDLVAQESNGDYWAIQCKFHEPTSTIDRREIDSFLAESGRRFTLADGTRTRFSSRLIVSTTDRWGKNAEDALDNQDIPVSRVGLPDLAAAPIDWERFRPSDLATLKRRAPRALLEHQAAAVSDIVVGFRKHDRGKLIMACGTGKTFTTLRLSELVGPKIASRVLFLAPSISLISQALREWTAEAVEPITPYVVCSDSKVGKDHEDIRVHDLAYPPTTDPTKLLRAVAAADSTRRVVIFSTYQSIGVIAKAQDLGLPDFDLIICDEAHRTAGLTLPDEDPSHFTIVHDRARIRGHRRLYMTATPRIYGDASKSKAGERNATLYSMDDETTYGPEFHRLGFAKSVTQNLLSDYKVVIVAVDEDRIAALTNNYNNAFALNKKEAISTALATKIIGSWNGLSSRNLLEIGDHGQATQLSDGPPMRRAIAFSQSIQNSKDITRAFETLTDLHQRSNRDEDTMVHCLVDHVDGTMNSVIRQEKLAWLKAEEENRTCRILSNARCLSEGINVPTLDAVIFFDTRDSIVDIVQSVGRVMRKAEGKQFGYIVLPVCVPRRDIAEYQAYLDSDKQFKGIWKVLKALRAHDESLIDESEFRRKIKLISAKSRGGEGPDEYFDDPTIELPLIDVAAFSEAVYAAIPKKLGDREYWAEWASTIAPIATRVAARIEELIAKSTGRDAFDRYVSGLQENINPSVTTVDAVDMLTQHVITRPIFDAIFEDNEFVRNNPVSRAMQHILEILDEHVVDSETSELGRFYENVRERLAYAKSAKSRQDVIRNLYDTFFRRAFPKTSERLGIVYTPTELVDFIIASVDVALRTHFGKNIGDEHIHIIDPFVGTGTFLVRLMQSGFISSSQLRHKYSNELHANELVLLAYYIAAINIESSYLEITGTHEAFEGIVLTDTFQSYGVEQGSLNEGFSRENNARLQKQRTTPIRVVIGNPPYSSGQVSANDNNQRQSHPALEDRIAQTYGEGRSGGRVRHLKNAETKAIRWASDRIGTDGIMAYVTNGSVIDGNSADGLRKCLGQEFSHLYILNCRGNAHGSGELRQKEAGNVFGEGSRSSVAVIIAIKDANAAMHTISYHDIGDYLTGKQKLETIAGYGDISGVGWETIIPNASHDWINQRDEAYTISYLILGDKRDRFAPAIFSSYSLGIVTNRDAWTYNFSVDELRKNVTRFIDTFNSGTRTTDATKIKWSDSLESIARRQRRLEFNDESLIVSSYRPFVKQHLYYDKDLVEQRNLIPSFFPTPNHANRVICVTGPISGRQTVFSALMTSDIPNLHLIDSGQCFPLYVYERGDTATPNLLSASDAPDRYGYVRRTAIKSEAVSAYRTHYGDQSIMEEDIFHHVYGVLHAPDYRERHANDLRKILARVPYTRDFWAFANAGRELADLHVNYEIAEPWPLVEHAGLGKANYNVKKMRFRSKTDRSAIIYNEYLTLDGLPSETHAYVVNGRSAIEWIMERYQDAVDKDSGIRNNPNDWSDDPRYIVDLVKRIVRVSVETVRIVKALPPGLAAP